MDECVPGMRRTRRCHGDAVKRPKVASHRTHCCLWIALFLYRYRTITFEQAQSGLGISMRTYRRCISDLQEAGLILDSERTIKGTHLVAFDEVLAPVRGA